MFLEFVGTARFERSFFLFCFHLLLLPFWRIKDVYKNRVDRQYYIGNTSIDIRGDNLVIGDREYEGTPGLWEVIIS